jgi:hypothetical protein
MTIENLDVNSIPQAPNLVDARGILKEAMTQYPKQAEQILTALGAAKKAKQEGYESYAALCDELGVEPIGEALWGTTPIKEVMRPVVAASLKANLPGVDISASDVELLLDATSMPSKRAAAARITEIVMKVLLGAPSEKVQSWAGLAKAAATLI